MRCRLILFLLMTTALVTTQAEAANIRVFTGKDRAIIISFTGRIIPGDQHKFLETVAPYRAKDLILYLDSIGGNMRSAYHIGRIVRRFGIITVIANGRRCLSACSLVFFGGWDKYNSRHYRIKHPWGKFGLHHPHDEVRGRRSKTSKKDMVSVRAYFKRMKAGDVLYRQMVRTSWRGMSYVKNRTLSRLTGYYIKSDRATYPARPPARLSSNGHIEYYRQDKLPPAHIEVRPPLPVRPARTSAPYVIEGNPDVKPDLIEFLRHIAGN